jgi:hypothetical protein
MAFFAGHRAYAAVEAMIARRPNGTFAARAILTRHKQTQIDHVNDAAIADQMAGAKREICARDIDIGFADTNVEPRVTVAFVSHAGEDVLLDFTAVGQPDPARAGLTDPGQHSSDASLPLL